MPELCDYFRLAEYLVILEEYRNKQKKETDSQQNGQQVPHESQPDDLHNVGGPEILQSTEPNTTHAGTGKKPQTDNTDLTSETTESENQCESDNNRQRTATTNNTEVPNSNDKSQDETDDEITTEVDTSKDLDPNAAPAKPQKKKRRKSQFSTLKASLQVQLSEEEVKSLPKGTAVTPQQVEQLLVKYDLPKFTPLPNMGPSKILSPQEEEIITVYLNELDSFGIARTVDEFQQDVQFYFNSKPKDDKTKGHVFGEKTISVHCILLIPQQHFRSPKRHNQISLPFIRRNKVDLCHVF